MEDLHVHTDRSIMDGAIRPEELVRTLKEMGRKAVVVTDHGTLLGIEDVREEAERAGMKFIPGVEAYVGGPADESEEKMKERTGLGSRMHLVMIAKNYQGYQEISKLVTKSNENIVKTGRFQFPVMTEEMIESVITGENVYALSGCVQGVLASIILHNKIVDRDIKKLQKKQSKYISPSAGSYLGNLKKMEKAVEDLKFLSERKNNLEKASKTALVKKEKEAVKSGDKDRMEAVQKEKKEKEEAKKKLPGIRKEVAEMKKYITKINGVIKKADNSIQQWKEIQNRIEELEEKKQTDKDLYATAKEKLMWYKETFGDGNFLIELQYHGLEDEAEVFPILARLAEETDTPVIATNDAHMTDNSEKNVTRRMLLKSQSFKRYAPATDIERQLYLKTEKELAEYLSKIIPEDIVKKAIANTDVLVANCEVQFPKESHYPVFKDEQGNLRNAGKYLWGKCLEGRKKLIEKGVWNEVYENRLHYEFGVIKKMGFLDYLAIVQNFIEYGEKKAKDNPEGVGTGIGLGRGSAAGSLVCFLSGITKIIDPVRYGLLFERFLNVERVTMPDIDTDFANFIRDDVIRYVKRIYGKDAVCSIVTKGTQAGKSAIRNAARVYGWYIIDKFNQVGEAKEETKKRYNVLADRLCKEITDEENWKEELLSETRSQEEVIIIEWAGTIEGTITQTGIHAAGVIISDNDDVSDYIPLMWDSDSLTWKSQYDMVQAENAGLLKMDFLGLKTLDILTGAFRYIARNYKKKMTMENIPFEEEVFRHIFAEGRTDGVFQFESDGMKAILKDFCPENIEDLILLNAVYRPGPMQYISGISAVKKGKKKPAYLIDGMEDILAPTYGYPVYQEQIMQLFQLVGFTLGEADIIRRYMSKKKKEKFMAYQYAADGHPGFVDGMVSKGAKKEDAIELWNQLVEFSKYAFNKSHSAAYALTAYYTGYIKYHYPAEYIASFLNVKPEKIAMFQKDLKYFGIHFGAPDVNEAGRNFTPVGKRIVFGYKGIDGIGEKDPVIDRIVFEREKEAFKDLKDVVLRVKMSESSLLLLNRAGAFDSICTSRRAVVIAAKDLISIAEKVREKIESGKPAEDILEEYREMEVPEYIRDDKEEILKEEKSLCGVFLTGSPMVLYKNPDNKPISKHRYGHVTLYGYLDMKSMKTKKGKWMMKGTLSDEEDSIAAFLFPKQMEISGKIDPGVYLVTGKYENVYNDFSGQEERRIIIESVEPAQKRTEAVVVSFRKQVSGQEVAALLGKYHVQKGGYRLIVYDITGVKETSWQVSEEIITDKRLDVALV